MYQLLCLDMDGTLRDELYGIPKSAIEAVRMSQKKGCSVCLCTGRTLGTITDDVRELHLNGIIAGGGSYIEYSGQVLRNSTFQAEKMRQVYTYLTQYSVAFALETQEQIFMNRGAVQILIEQNERKWKTLDEGHRKKVQAEQKIMYVDNMAAFSPERNRVSKLCLWSDEKIYKKIEEILKKGNIYLAQQSLEPNYQYYEIIQRGCDKGTALKVLCGHLGILNSAVIAFGDGKNDIDMFREAGTAVAMGNGCRDIHPFADTVCEEATKDGIYLELKRRNII